MFKAHILVNDDTDIGSELDAINRLAKRHSLDDVKALVLMRNVEDVLSELKKQGAETGGYGIKMNLTKRVATEDYDIRFELRPRSQKTSKKLGPLSRLFGR